MMELDFNDLAAFGEGQKTLRAELEGCAGRVKDAVEKIRRGGSFLGWVDLPLDERQARGIGAYVASLPAGIAQAVILGIGGSSLGPRALWSGLFYPSMLLDGWRPAGGRRLLFLDNADPETVEAVFDGLDPAKTLFVAVTKSGSTAETAAQLMIAWERAHAALGAKAKDHFVFVTDPAKGDLRALAAELGVASFPVPPDVGGRFSVFSSVGLLPAALAGIDPLKILAGAGAARDRCLETDLFRNPAAMLGAAAFLLDTQLRKTVHVFWAYADRLADAGDWFVQLWGESLGKRRGGGGVGPTPVAARGATDQHSLLQLLREGPADKFVIFVDVKKRRRLPVPPLFGGYKSFAYLGGHGMEELIACERAGTQRSLARAGVPTLGISLEEVTEGSIAALMYLLEVATAVAGFLYEVDPFDQPGVEESKRFAQALMGRPGLEEIRAALERGAGAGDPALRFRL
jgi:glucose-6-phosphate isomerase